MTLVDLRKVVLLLGLYEAKCSSAMCAPQLNHETMSARVRHLFEVFHELVPWVCILYQRSESCVSALLPALWLFG